MKYYVICCGGCNDGTVILTTDDLGDAINAAHVNEDRYECGCYIMDEKGDEYEW